MDSHDVNKLQRAIRELVLAEIANSWKGNSYPEDVPIIEENLRRARIRVSVIIAQLASGKGTEP